MKRFASNVALAIVASALSVGAGTVTASAAKEHTRGRVIDVYLAGSLGSSGQTIVITGAFADAGRFTQAAPTSKVVLSKGSFKVDDSKGAALESALFADLQRIVDPKTCGLSVSYTARATLKNGTGAYRGIKGSVRIKTTLAGVFPRLASRKCNLSSNAQPIGFVILSQGSGRVVLR
jgi:hypothetical protein